MSQKEPTREELIEAIRELEPYVRHRKDCTFNGKSPRGDFCTCGVGDVIDDVDTLMKKCD